MKDMAIITVIESSQNNRGDINNKYGLNNVSLNYEAEAILCFEAWRTRAGKLADIPIYCICPTRNVPSRETIQAITDLGVTYIEHFMPETDTYISGYWNVPLACSYLEKILSHDFLIHIDLDMYLIKEPKESLFSCHHTKLAKLAINEHRPTNQPGISIKPIYNFEINTGFICSWREAGFYKKWYERLKRKTLKLDYNDPAYSIWEERICDVMYFEEDAQFEFFNEPFQINEDVSNYEDDEIKEIIFFHGHCEMTKRNDKYMQIYLKRLKNIKKRIK